MNFLKRNARFMISGVLLGLLIFVMIPYQISYKPDNTAIAAYKEAVLTPFGYEYNSNALQHIIIYPGGLVSHIAYAPLAYGLAQKGYRVSVLEVPLNLAITQPLSLLQVDTSQSSHIILMGHSLGGVAASIAMESVEVDGLILLGSYPLNASNLLGSPKILSVLGSLDGLLNMEAYEEATKNIMIEEVIINGGNHAQFGSYGPQANDLSASITPTIQLNMTINAIDEWILSWIQP